MKTCKEEITMYIIVDKKMPAAVVKKLAGMGEVIRLHTSGITYEAISGHPDVFIHTINENTLVIAPNLPQKFKNLLSETKMNIVEGNRPVGPGYPATASYNAVSTEHTLIHNFRHTDPVIKEMKTEAGFIHVEQGYTRCNLLAISDRHFISSDAGITTTLKNNGKNCLFIDPKGILLPGFKHGFLGGCCGLHHHTVYLSGSLAHHPGGEDIRKYLLNLGFSLHELYKGPLFDGGGILFLPKS
jgi:hypothetical protein